MYIAIATNKQNPKETYTGNACASRRLAVQDLNRSLYNSGDKKLDDYKITTRIFAHYAQECDELGLPY